MKRRPGALGTASFFISILALTVALSSGTAYAAVLIKTKNIKNQAVTAAKLANNSVTGAKVKNGSLSLADFTAADQARLLGPRRADTVRVELGDVVVPAGDAGTHTVWCPSDRKVVGGGYFSSLAIPSLSAPNADRSGWVVQFNNFDGIIDVEVNGYAICS